MPPLRVWFLGFAVSGACWYGGYYQVYLPRQLEQLKLESRWEREKQAVQWVWQQLAHLEQWTEEWKKDPARPTLSNTEKVLLFCRVQDARIALLEILQSEDVIVSRSFNRSQALEFLDRLNNVERVNCTALTFRHSLSLLQKSRYWLCLCLYVISFTLLPLVLPAAVVQRHVLHPVSQWIVRTLEIPCSMSVESGGAAPSVNGGASVRIVLPARHWIEEVGYWSCLRTLETEAVLEGAAVPYPLWWLDIWRRVGSTLRLADGVDHVENQFFGYPLAPSLPCSRKGVEVLIPVAVEGLSDICAAQPSALETEPLNSEKNVRKKGTSHYAHVIEQQYGKGNPESSLTKETVPTASDASHSSTCTVYRRSWIGYVTQKYGLQVYGGSAAWRDGRPYRSLHFHVGRPCSSEEDAVKALLSAWRRSCMKEVRHSLPSPME